jgi:hypothetical protein
MGFIEESLYFSNCGRLLKSKVACRLDRVRRSGDGALHARAPILVVAQVRFLQADARIGNVERLFDLEQILHLRSGERIWRLAKLRRCPRWQLLRPRPLCQAS